MVRDTTQTPVQNFDRPAIGSDWATAWDTLVESLDEKVVERGQEADRPASGTYDGQLYLALDTQKLYSWDDAGSTWNEAVSGGSGGTQFKNVQTFSSEADLPDTNANGEIPLDPDVLWVLDAAEPDMPVQISSPIVSTDTSQALTISGFASTQDIQTVNNRPQLLGPAIEYTGTSTPFVGQNDITVLFKSITVFASNQPVFNVGGTARIVGLDGARIGSSVGELAECSMAGRQLVLISSVLNSPVALDGSILVVQRGSRVVGSPEFTGSENIVFASNSDIDGTIDNNGTMQFVELYNIAGDVGINGIDPAAPNVTIKHVSGIPDERVTETISPTSSGTTESPGDFVNTVYVTPDGTTTIDLSSTAQTIGREIRFIQTGEGSNTPVTSFQSTDFVGTKPADLQNAGENVTVEYVDPASGWIVEQ